MREWLTFTSQRQWREYLTELIKTNNKALLKSIILIYNRQTEDEKNTRTTSISNGMGFGQIDADFLSSLATQIQEGKSLTPKQLAIARNKMPKYWRQLMIISKKKMEEEDMELDKKIQQLRHQMEHNIETLGALDPATIAVSQELDKYIVEYQRRLKGESVAC